MGKHLLGPHVVGRRVVIRSLVRGETGPTGGPALTDVLGTCESWTDQTVVVARDDGSGERVRIAVADIVSGKPVPPRASVRMRITPRDAQVRAQAMWPGLATRPLGEWLLRAGTADVRRTCSALAMGDPGMPIAEAAAHVVAHAREHDLPALTMVEVGGAVEAELLALGWHADRPGEAEVELRLASVARALRAARRAAAGEGAEVEVLEDGAGATARVTGAGVARAAYADDWVGIRALEVDPWHRRRGLGRALVAALLDWGAEQGATTACTQVRVDNAASTQLFAQLGFTAHHAYRYLAPPVGVTGAGPG